MVLSDYGFVRSGICSLDGSIGNVKENAQQIIQRVNVADKKGINILIFPELSITGYTIQDMFFQDSLEKETIKALAEIKIYTKDTDVLFVVGMPLRVNALLYNVAVVIFKGEILGVVPKTYLPNQGEFYEKSISCFYHLCCFGVNNRIIFF